MDTDDTAPDDTPPDATAGSSATQMYFAIESDTTLAEWLNDPAATELFDATFRVAELDATALVTVTVPGVGSFDLVNLIDHTHGYDYVVRCSTDPWEGFRAVAQPKPSDAFRAVETAFRVLGIDRTLHPTPLTHAGPYWYAVLMPQPEPRRRYVV